MPQEFARLENDLSRGSSDSKWLAKPSGSKNGRGIKVLEDASAALTAGAEARAGVLIQEYVYPPFLTDGLKSSIRLYVACTDIEPLRLYIYDVRHTRPSATTRPWQA